MKRHITTTLCLFGVLGAMACQVSNHGSLEHDKKSALLDGHWHQIPTSTGRIKELQFAGNQFWVTYTPFESYRDFWGSFHWNPETNSISMSIENSNHAPQPFDGVGTLRLITPNRIKISGVTLDDHDLHLKTFTFERFDSEKVQSAPRD